MTVLEVLGVDFEDKNAPKTVKKVGKTEKETETV